MGNFDLELHQMNFVTAFLQSELDKEVYIDISDGIDGV